MYNCCKNVWRSRLQQSAVNIFWKFKNTHRQRKFKNNRNTDFLALKGGPDHTLKYGQTPCKKRKAINTNRRKKRVYKFVEGRQAVNMVNCGPQGLLLDGLRPPYDAAPLFSY